MHHRSSLARARRTSQRGWTLVELMVVVVIVGTLATLATVSIKKYVAASKTTEAIDFIREIRSAQEAYRGETEKYLPVSSEIDDFYPKNSAPGQQKMNFPGTKGSGIAAWETLGVRENAPVLFVYACTAGPPGDPTPGPGITVPNWNPPGGPWYVVKAKADLDNDGVDTVYLATSFWGEVFSENE